MVSLHLIQKQVTSLRDQNNEAKLFDDASKFRAMSQRNTPTQASFDDVEISCRFGERVIVDRGLLKKASDLNLDAPARLIVTHQPFYAVYSVTRMLIGGQRIQLTVDNVIDFWLTARTLHLRTLVDQLEHFVAEHLNEVARVKAEMLKVDEKFMERLLEKRKSKGVARILYRWWRADVKNRQAHFVNLVNKFTPENDDETLSASTEDANVLKKVEVLRKKSASAPALNRLTSFSKPEVKIPVPPQSPAAEPSLAGSAPVTPVPSDAKLNEPKLANQEGISDQKPAENKTPVNNADETPSPMPLETAGDATPAKTDPKGDQSPDEEAPVALKESPAMVDVPLSSSESPPAESKQEQPVAAKCAADGEHLPQSVKPPAPSPAILPVTSQTDSDASAVNAFPAHPVAPYALPGRPVAVTTAPRRSVVIHNVFGKPLAGDQEQTYASPGNRATARPSQSRRSVAKSRHSNDAVRLRTAPSKSESVNSVRFEPVHFSKNILIGDKICDFQEHSVRSVASIGRDISPHSTTVVCDPCTRTYAEIDCFGVIRNYLSHIEISTKSQKVRSIMTQLDENRPLLWMSDGSFHAVLDKKLLPCPNEIPDSSPLKDLPEPPHDGWLARMYLGADCALLYYHCWGLYVRRRGEPRWQLRCEDLFIEYMTPIGRSNRFFIVAKRTSSFILYKTGDVTQGSDLMFASEPIAILKKWNRHERCSIVRAASSGVRVLFKTFNLQTSTLHFERINMNDLTVTSLPIV